MECELFAIFLFFDAYIVFPKQLSGVSREEISMMNCTGW